MIFPFLPWMVDDLRGTVELSVFYVGLMASVYMAGQTIAALIFPQLSDSVLGRKKSIVLGHFALIFPMLMFGFARTYWEAFFWRFLNGALQCNRPITTAVIAEITDETNQPAKAYGLGAMSGRGLAGGLPARIDLPSRVQPERLVGARPPASAGRAVGGLPVPAALRRGGAVGNRRARGDAPLCA